MSESAGALDGYRVLDLAESGAGLCARLLADWGADVLNVEPPAGSAIRGKGPFYHDLPHPERSLFFAAYNTGKRSITLNIASRAGQDILRRLAKSADFLMESYPPGYLDSLGLGYSSLSHINPGLIMTSITPFGQKGPYSAYASCEIVSEAMGGAVYEVGTPDRPPVRPMAASFLSVPSLVAEMHVDAGSMVDNYDRLITGKGQQVDVAVQECISNTLLRSPINWDTLRALTPRVGGGVSRTSRGVTAIRRGVYPCQYGYAQALLHGEWFEPMVEWLDSEGAAGDLKRDMEKWKVRLSTTADPPLSQAEVDHIEVDVLGKFLAGKTRDYIYREAEARGMGWGGICSVGEGTRNEQLQSRSFFVRVDHPELGEALTYPDSPFEASGTQPRVTRRAPLIGEHNAEVYSGELGLSPNELVSLRESGAI